MDLGHDAYEARLTHGENIAGISTQLPPAPVARTIPVRAAAAAEAVEAAAAGGEEAAVLPTDLFFTHLGSGLRYDTENETFSVWSGAAD